MSDKSIMAREVVIMPVIMDKMEKVVGAPWSQIVLRRRRSRDPASPPIAYLLCTADSTRLLLSDFEQPSSRELHCPECPMRIMHVGILIIPSKICRLLEDVPTIHSNEHLPALFVNPDSIL